MAAGVRRDGARTRKPPLLRLTAAVAPFCVGWVALVIAGAGGEPWALGACCAGAVLAGTVAALPMSRGVRRGHGVRLRERHDRAASAARRRLEKMDPVRLGTHVAELCRRDGLADVATVRVRDDAYSVDVTGTLADGTRLAVRCRSVVGPASVSGSVVTRFTAAESRRGDVLVLVTNACGFSPRARALAASEDGPLLLDRRELALWDLGTGIPVPLRTQARPHGSTATSEAAAEPA